MTIDTLGDYGLQEMDDEAISRFLRTRSVGVLGLPAERAPYLLPIAFGYDGGDRLYFTYFVGETSRKVTLTERADVASFLAYAADSMFAWESVLLEGMIEEVPAEEWDDHAEALSNAWRLDVFERAESAGEIRIYTFEITDRHGLTYAELPPGFRD